MATIVKNASGTWIAVIRKAGFPTNAKTFRLKKYAEHWARRTEDEMARVPDSLTYCTSNRWDTMTLYRVYSAQIEYVKRIE
jgi:hypothetical protein